MRSDQPKNPFNIWFFLNKFTKLVLKNESPNKLSTTIKGVPTVISVEDSAMDFDHEDIGMGTKENSLFMEKRRGVSFFYQGHIISTTTSSINNKGFTCATTTTDNHYATTYNNHYAAIFNNSQVIPISTIPFRRMVLSRKADYRNFRNTGCQLQDTAGLCPLGKKATNSSSTLSRCSGDCQRRRWIKRINWQPMKPWTNL